MLSVNGAYGEPQHKNNRKRSVPDIQAEETAHAEKNALPVVQALKPTYADVVANKDSQAVLSPGGYTTSGPSRLDDLNTQSGRPQRTRQPPVRYGNYVTH